MTNTNITNLRKNLFDYANACIKYNDIINVNTKEGNVIMLSEEEYNGIMETLYLCSIPGMKESITRGMNTPVSECEEFKW
jgi:antitoxin YefM